MLAVVKQWKPTSRGKLSHRQWAVLQYADAMTRRATIPQQKVEDLRAARINQQEIVEMTATVAAYNLTCRFVLALDVSEGTAIAPDWFRNLGQ